MYNEANAVDWIDGPFSDTTRSDLVLLIVESKWRKAIDMDADLAAAVVPYVTALAGAYGATVVERVRDAAADATADATVGVGRRLLRRILKSEDAAGPVTAAVHDLAADPGDADAVAALRLQLRKALAADPDLTTEVAHLLRQADTAVTASGAGSIAMQHNTGIVQTGADSRAWQGRP